MYIRLPKHDQQPEFLIRICIYQVYRILFFLLNIGLRVKNFR